MSVIVDDKRETLAEHDLMFIAGCPAVYHSHHYNLFFDQTVDDALGPERGMAIRARASHEANYRLLRSVLEDQPEVPEQRLELAAALFAALGQGRIDLDVGERGGAATAEALHYGEGWKRKYGRKVARSYPTDAYGAGFVAAAIEVAYELAPGELSCIQTQCPSIGADRAEFDVRRIGSRFEARGIDKQAVTEILPASLGGLHEDRIGRVAAALSKTANALESDERGLLDAFGVLMTCHPADYYNHLTTRTLDIGLTEKPHSLDVARALFREAAHACAFHTLGGILTAPEWAAVAEPPPAKPIDVIVGGVAAGRALGYGAWALEAYVPDESLVLRSPGTYESVYARLTRDEDQEPCSFQLQGAAMALMQLAHRLDWRTTPAVTVDSYLELRREDRYTCKQTHCIARGDTMDRVVVTRAA